MTGEAAGSPRSGSPAAPTIAVVGMGVTGRATADRLTEHGCAVVSVHAPRLGDEAGSFSPGDLTGVDLAVLCQGASHAPLAARLVRAGCPVVSVADQLDDVDDLLALDEVARSNGVALVVGAGMSPGLSGLLARHLAAQVAVVEEIHVAVHGTGGPACARQHHESLGRGGIAWHDGEWLERPGGSGRELCWFPEPVDARDCYRAALADPRLLQRCFPQARRVSARVSANRRDRLTARLPMFIPPRSGGDEGAVRVEVRGAQHDASRETVVIGAAGRVADLAGAVAAATAVEVAARQPPDGVVVLGDTTVDAAAILGRAQRFGVVLQEFTGLARATAW